MILDIISCLRTPRCCGRQKPHQPQECGLGAPLPPPAAVVLLLLLLLVVSACNNRWFPRRTEIL